MKTSFTFKKSERLKKRKYIEALFTTGKALSHFPFRCIYTITDQDSNNHESPVQFGISVPKKKLKTAVDRNLIKRRSREAWRLNKTQLDTVVIHQHKALKLFFIYQSPQIESFDTIQNAFTKIIARLEALFPLNSE